MKAPRGSLGRLRLAVLVMAAASLMACDGLRPPWLWVHESGATLQDYGSALAVDDLGDVAVVGVTDTGMPGAPEPNAGSRDMWIASYSTTGTRQWIHQFGSAADDFVAATAVNGAGDIYAAGITTGSLPGAPAAQAGNGDAFVVKYDRTGQLIWVRQFGTATEDEATGVSVDASGNVYLSGYTGATMPGSTETNAGGDDAFVKALAADGTPLWTHQLGGAADDQAWAAASHGSAVAIAGTTFGTVPGSPTTGDGSRDAFVASYDTTGSRQWVRQLGTAGDDRASGVAFDDDGRVYLTGATDGALGGAPETPAGGPDAFVASYDGSGVKRWVHLLGGSSLDQAQSVTVGLSDEVYIAGSTFGNLPGTADTNAGSGDVFVARFDVDGNRLAVNMIGSKVTGNPPSGQDNGTSVGVDGDGQVFVTGEAAGHFPGAPEQLAGYTDAFVGSLRPGLPTITPGQGSTTEGNAGPKSLQVPVTLSRPSSHTITVPWSTVYVADAPGDQATEPDDYAAASGTVTFAPGETSQSVTISINGDQVSEPDEYLLVSFTPPANAKMGGAWGLGTGTILNDD